MTIYNQVLCKRLGKKEDLDTAFSKNLLPCVADMYNKFLQVDKKEDFAEACYGTHYRWVLRAETLMEEGQEPVEGATAAAGAAAAEGEPSEEKWSGDDVVQLRKVPDMELNDLTIGGVGGLYLACQYREHHVQAVRNSLGKWRGLSCLFCVFLFADIFSVDFFWLLSGVGNRKELECP